MNSTVKTTVKVAEALKQWNENSDTKRKDSRHKSKIRRVL